MAGEGGRMRKSFGVVHVLAKCEDCDWETGSYKNGQAIAAIHAEKYRHKVSVEFALAGYYDGR